MINYHPSVPKLLINVSIYDGLGLNDQREVPVLCLRRLRGSSGSGYEMGIYRSRNFRETAHQVSALDFLNSRSQSLLALLTIVAWAPGSHVQATTVKSARQLWEQECRFSGIVQVTSLCRFRLSVRPCNI